MCYVCICWMLHSSIKHHLPLVFLGFLFFKIKAKDNISLSYIGKKICIAYGIIKARLHISVLISYLLSKCQSSFFLHLSMSLCFQELLYLRIIITTTTTIIINSIVSYKAFSGWDIVEKLP